jgi:translation initiation factor 2 subunit 2
MARSSSFDYGKLLARARGELPEELSHDSRWALPAAEILYEGRTTILRNWKDILDTLRRDEQHVLSYLLREIGTAGDSEGGDRVVFVGKLAERQIQDKLDQYVDTFVMCDECHRPDTHLTKDGRTTLLKCDACGAHKPVKAKKKRDDVESTTIVAGRVYDVEITGHNEKKVPFGVVHGVKIFVPGAEKGTTVKAKIERVLGPSAVAKLVE